MNEAIKIGTNKINFTSGRSVIVGFIIIKLIFSFGAMLLQSIIFIFLKLFFLLDNDLTILAGN